LFNATSIIYLPIHVLDEKKDLYELPGRACAVWFFEVSDIPVCLHGDRCIVYAWYGCCYI